MQKILNVAETVRFGADRLDELARARINATLRCAVALGLGEKPAASSSSGERRVPERPEA